MVQYFQISVTDSKKHSFYVTLTLIEQENAFEVEKGIGSRGIYISWVDPKLQTKPGVFYGKLIGAEFLSNYLEEMLKPFVNGNKRFPKGYEPEEYFMGSPSNTFEVDYLLVGKKNAHHIKGLATHIPPNIKDILEIFAGIDLLEKEHLDFMYEMQLSQYFESHCHPDHPLIEKPHNYVKDALNAGIKYMLIAPITYDSNYKSMELFPKKRFPNVLFAKGLHPKYAYNISLWNEKEIEKFKSLVESDDRIVAIKSGIDLSKKNLQAHQIERQFAFLQLFHDLAYAYKKPLVLHIREAAEEALEYFEKNPLLIPAEVHCFTYDKEIMHRFIRVGVGYFGIGGMITRPGNEELVKAVKEMPLERILLESDSPFVKVEGEANKVNTSDRALSVVAEKIAQLKGISVERVVEQTYLNACKFFGV